MTCEKHLGLACLCENSAATQVIDRLIRELAEVKGHLENAKHECDAFIALKDMALRERDEYQNEAMRLMAHQAVLCDERDGFKSIAEDYVSEIQLVVTERDDLQTRLDALIEDLTYEAANQHGALLRGAVEKILAAAKGEVKE